MHQFILQELRGSLQTVGHQFLELIGVHEVVTVVVADCNPLGVKVSAEVAVKCLDEVVVGEAEAFAAAQVVCIAPEFVGSVEANLNHQIAGGFAVDVFGAVVIGLHADDGIFRSHGVGGVLEALANRCPVLQTCFCNCTFGCDLGQCVVAVHGGLQGVTDSAPVVGRRAVADFFNSADVNKVGLFFLAELLNAPQHCQSGAVVGLQSCFCAEVVSQRGQQCANVANIVHVLHGFGEQIEIGQVTPDDVNLVCIGSQLFFVLLTGASQCVQFQLVGMFRKALYRFQTHNAGGTGQKYFLHGFSFRYVKITTNNSFMLIL